MNWRRCLLLVDNDYALVVDDLESTASHDYDWLFHCEGKRLDTSGLDPATTHATLACEQYTDVTTHTAAGSGEQIRWSADDGSGLALISALERGDLVFTARCPAETSVRTIPVAALRKTGKKARFASAICLFASAGEVPALPRIQMSDDGNIVVSSEDREDRLAIDNTSIILRSRRGTSTRSAEVKFGG